MKVLVAVFVMFMGVAAVASSRDSGDVSLNITCIGDEMVASQPCGGVNSREINLEASSNAGPFNVYKESRSYGGCYSVSDQGFGTIENVIKSGRTVQLTFIRKGFFNRTFPIVTAAPTESFTATLDLDSMVLSLGTSNLVWYYRNPSTLNCSLN